MNKLNQILGAKKPLKVGLGGRFILWVLRKPLKIKSVQLKMQQRALPTTGASYIYPLRDGFLNFYLACSAAASLSFVLWGTSRMALGVGKNDQK
jgi:hypothetical protein